MRPMKLLSALAIVLVTALPAMAHGRGEGRSNGHGRWQRQAPVQVVQPVVCQPVVARPIYQRRQVVYVPQARPVYHRPQHVVYVPQPVPVYQRPVPQRRPGANVTFQVRF